MFSESMIEKLSIPPPDIKDLISKDIDRLNVPILNELNEEHRLLIKTISE